MISNDWKQKQKLFFLDYDYAFVKFLPLSDIKNNNTYKFLCITIIIIIILIYQKKKKHYKKVCNAQAYYYLYIKTETSCERA